MFRIYISFVFFIATISTTIHYDINQNIASQHQSTLNQGDETTLTFEKYGCDKIDEVIKLSIIQLFYLPDRPNSNIDYIILLNSIDMIKTTLNLSDFGCYDYEVSISLNILTFYYSYISEEQRNIVIYDSYTVEQIIEELWRIFYGVPIL